MSSVGLLAIEDWVAREGIGYPRSYAETKKTKMTMLQTGGNLSGWLLNLKGSISAYYFTSSFIYYNVQLCSCV